MEATARIVAAALPEVVFEDGLGVRYLFVDPSGGPSTEVLALRTELATVPSFEFALRERVARLSGFVHPAFGALRGVDRVGGQEPGLRLRSDAVDGTRLSRLIDAAQSEGVVLDISTALCLTRQLVAAVAALHDTARDASHGAIAVERLILTPQGRLVVVEHGIGAALQQLRYSHEQYWTDLRLALPSSNTAVLFDQRVDVTQIGVVALGLLLGRPLTDVEIPAHIVDLVESTEGLSVRGGVEPLPTGLRRWLARALQLDPLRSFASAQDARADLDAVLGGSDDTASGLEAFLERVEQSGPLPGVSWRRDGADWDEEPQIPEPLRDIMLADIDVSMTRGRGAAAPVLPFGLTPLPETPRPDPKTAFEPIASESDFEPQHDVRASHEAEVATPHEVEVAAPHIEVTAAPEIESTISAGTDDDSSREVAFAPEVAPASQPDVAATPSLAVLPEELAEIPAADEVASMAAPALEVESTISLDVAPAPEDIFEAQTEPALVIEGTEAPEPQVSFAAAAEVVSEAAIEIAPSPEQEEPAFEPLAKGPKIFFAPKPIEPQIEEAPAPSPTPAIQMPTAKGRGRVWRGVTASVVSACLSAAVGMKMASRVPIQPIPPLAPGTLELSSGPAGVDAFVDGAFRGLTPLSIDLAPGVHTIELYRPSAERQSIPITLTAGMKVSQYADVPLAIEEDRADGNVADAGNGDTVSAEPSQPLQAALPSEMGWVSVVSDARIRIFENDAMIGSSRDRVELPSGDHELTLVDEASGINTTKVVRVETKKTAVIKVAMPTGALAVVATPRAEVWIDGNKRGDTPIGSLTLPAGAHDIVLRHAEFGDRRRAVVVTAGELVSLSVDLRAQ